MRIASPVRLLSLIAVLAAGSVSAQSITQWSWPVAASPSVVGVNKAVLDSIDREIGSGQYGLIDRMLVIRHGQIAYDRSYTQDYTKAYADSVNVKGALNASDPTGPYNYYNTWWHPYYRGGDLHSLQSVTKTITSVVIGTAVMNGEFPSIDTPALKFYDASKLANVDDRKRRMTIRHLVSMTSGIDWNESLPYTDPRNSATGLEASPDWVKYVMDRPMSDEPGARWVYNSGATVVLADIFHRATGKDIEQYAVQHLFAPLGISHWYWKRTPTGLVDTEGGLYLEARDLAKIWSVFAKNGEWQGKRIVSPEWVKASLEPIKKTPNGSSYGLAWWLQPTARDTSKFYYTGSGFGGQLPAALPEQDMLVVFNAWNILPGRGGLAGRRVLERLAAAATP
ncbi:MAG TPA: serine hydrolase [Gemmatimonadaceae bacterium]|jgi:CubicO group peptidase (beta-lactamase class C family)